MRIGDAAIVPVIELERVPYPLAYFFLDLDPGQFAAQLGWLAPEHYDPEADAALLSHHAWLVDVAGYKVLIDPCIGNHKKREVIAAYDGLDTPWLDRLAAAGARPEDIDFVFCTHLHVDHCGWNTRLEDGRWVPTFPNARYIFTKDEHAFWSRELTTPLPDALAFNRGVFIDSVQPVIEAGLALIVDGPFTFAECISLLPTPGHTQGHAAALLESGGDGIVFAGDAIHHPLQVIHPALSTRGFSDLAQSIESRRMLLDLCADRGFMLAPAHFRHSRACRVARTDGDGFAIDWIEGN